MAQSRAAAASQSKTRVQQAAIAIPALLLIALLGFYTLVTGRITDGSAMLKAGAGQASAGAGSSPPVPRTSTRASARSWPRRGQAGSRRQAARRGRGRN